MSGIPATRGRNFTPDESEAIARAFVSSTNNPTASSLQNIERFWQDVYARFLSLAPQDHEPGTWKDRPAKTIQTHWRDHLSKDVRLFCDSLRKVLESNPTWVSDQEKFNVAVALHMRVTDRPSYDYKDYDPFRWRFYKAWLVLKELPAFQSRTTPAPPAAAAAAAAATLTVKTPPAGVGTSFYAAAAGMARQELEAAADLHARALDVGTESFGRDKKPTMSYRERKRKMNAERDSVFVERKGLLENLKEAMESITSRRSEELLDLKQDLANVMRLSLAMSIFANDTTGEGQEVTEQAKKEMYDIMMSRSEQNENDSVHRFLEEEMKLNDGGGGGGGGEVINANGKRVRGRSKSRLSAEEEKLKMIAGKETVHDDTKTLLEKLQESIDKILELRRKDADLKQKATKVMSLSLALTAFADDTSKQGKQVMDHVKKEMYEMITSKKYSKKSSSNSNSNSNQLPGDPEKPKEIIQIDDETGKAVEGTQT